MKRYMPSLALTSMLIAGATFGGVAAYCAEAETSPTLREHRSGVAPAAPTAVRCCNPSLRT